MMAPSRRPGRQTHPSGPDFFFAVLAVPASSASTSKRPFHRNAANHRLPRRVIGLNLRLATRRGWPRARAMQARQAAHGGVVRAAVECKIQPSRSRCVSPEPRATLWRVFAARLTPQPQCQSHARCPRSRLDVLPGVNPSC